MVDNRKSPRHHCHAPFLGNNGAMRQIRLLSLSLLLPLLGACTSASSNYSAALESVAASRLTACHGYNCYFRTRFALDDGDMARIRAIMEGGAASPAAEREAVGRAVAYFEDKAGDAIGVRDRAKSTLDEGGTKGQMDCIDESTNTRTFMLLLQKKGLLKHHAVQSNVSRGFFLDARYPHSTAVLKERKSGRLWAVDSWYEPMGGRPDILALSEWKKRGVGGER